MMIFVAVDQEKGARGTGAAAGATAAAAPVRSAPKKLSEIMSEEIGSLARG